MAPPDSEYMLEPSRDCNIDKIAARLPNFWPETADLYFLSIEASFK